MGDHPGRGKVFGIGLNRTGTTSLTKALDILGFRVIHFPFDEITQQEVYRFSRSSSQKMKLSLLESHDGITDTVACYLYQALDHAYPGSRFILTVRDKQSWLESCEHLLEELLRPLYDVNANARYTEYHRFIHTQVYGIPHFDRAIFSQAFDAYHSEAERYFRTKSSQLLVLDICGGEGWDRLAPFLGKPIPEAPFPFENRRNKVPAVDLPGPNSEERWSAASLNEIEAYLNAFRNRDIDSCVEFFEDNAVLTFQGRHYRGRNAIRQWHQDRLDSGVELVDIRTVSTVDDSIVVDGIVSARILVPWKVKIHGQLIVEFGESRIQTLQFAGGRLVR